MKTPAQHAVAVATAIAAFAPGGDQAALTTALTSAFTTYDGDVGGLTDLTVRLQSSVDLYQATIGLFNVTGEVALVDDLPAVALTGEAWMVTTGGMADHLFLRSGPRWLDLFTLLKGDQGASAYEVWRAQLGNGDKTEADYLAWLADAQIEAVEAAVGPLADAASEAKAAAQAAQTAAEAARDLAVTAKDTAVTKAGEAAASATGAAGSKTGADMAKAAAEAARDAAVTAKDAAVTKAGEAVASATGAAGAKTGADMAKAAAEAARDLAVTAKDTAVTKAGEAAASATGAAASKTGADTAKAAAEAARDLAVTAKDTAVTKADEAAASATEAATSKTGADTAKAAAEAAQAAAEAARDEAETIVGGDFIVRPGGSDKAGKVAVFIAPDGASVGGRPIGASASTDILDRAAGDGRYDRQTDLIDASRLTGAIDAARLPAIAITDTFEAGSQAAMLALTAQRGDVAIRTDENKTYVLSTDDPTILANWKWMRTPTDLVLSVAGLTGAVTASALRVALALAISDVAGLEAALDGKQAGSTILSALAGLAAAGDKLAYFTSDSAMALTDLSGFGRTLAGLANYAALKTGLALAISDVSELQDALDAKQAALTKAAGSDLWGGADDAKYLTAKALYDASALVALVDGATVAVDLAEGMNFSLTLGGNRTLGAPANAKIGGSGVIIVKQDGTGSRTLAYNTAWKFAGGAPALSTAAGAIDMIAYFVEGPSLIRASLQKGFA